MSRQKLKVVDIETACQCPFYMQDTSNNHHCILKLTNTPQSISELLENNQHSDLDYWDYDCEGTWDKCSILPILYKYKEDDIPSAEIASDDAIQSYSPFTDSEDPDDYPDQQESPIITLDTNLNKKPKTTSVEKFPTKISIHVVKNPYLVKGDILVYPTNNQLYIDDFELRKMLKNSIDEELNVYLKNSIKMGHIYSTSNGGGRSLVKAKSIYHAVVAGTSRLVNEKDVSDSTFRALVKASLEQAESVIIIPGDCGILDIYATAMIQIGTIKEFLSSNKDISIKNIFIVMTDEHSHEVFTEYYHRIFKQKKVLKKQLTNA